MSADDIAGTGESLRLDAKRQCNKQDDSRGVAGCVTQLLRPLPHIRTAKKETILCGKQCNMLWL